MTAPATPQTSDGDAPALDLQGVTKRYGDKQALKGITLRVPRGAIYGILGPNGAGKTTTIRIALGMLRPDAGTASTLGVDPLVDAMAVRRKTGVVLEHDGHYEPMSVRENLEFFARLHGVGVRERGQRVDEMLELCGLKDREDTPVGGLSKGMKRLLALARAILHGPQLLILDEPTTGVDARVVEMMRDLLRRAVQQHGVSVLLATHNLHEAERLCDRVAIMNEGEVILEGHPQLLGIPQSANRATLQGEGFTQKLVGSLKKVPGVSAVALDKAEPGRLDVHLEPGARVAPVVRQAVTNGACIEAVLRETASLEEVFLRTTDPNRSREGAR